MTARTRCVARAYRVESIVLQHPETFDWYNEKLLQFLEKNDVLLPKDGFGYVWIPVQVLKAAVEKAEELELPKDRVEALLQDIDAAKSLDADYLWYFCY